MSIATGFEASEDRAYKEPQLTDPDEPPPAPVMLGEPAPVATITLEGSEPAYTEYPEPGQPGDTGGLVREERLCEVSELTLMSTQPLRSNRCDTRSQTEAARLVK